MVSFLSLMLYGIIHVSLTTSASVTDCVTNKEKSIYDYIVVGSGPGGTTIATRLALNDFKVLLIEAGPDYDDLVTQTPVLWPVEQLNPLITARFNPFLFSKEQKTTIEYPRGITLGGSAHINAMIAVTAVPSDWDNIAQVTNDADWNSQNIQTKYEKLVENCEYCSSTDPTANKNGWLDVSIGADVRTADELFPSNAIRTGLIAALRSREKFNPNVNKNKTYDGYFDTPKSVSQSTGKRSGTYPRIKNVQAMRPANLDVWTNSFVTKLVIDPATKNTCGVQYTKGSNLYKANTLALASGNSNLYPKLFVYAKREVIVSGGPWMTPQLLQLSGIGDRTLLSGFGIDTLQHLPGVGMNQQDRNEVPYVLKLKSNPILPGFVNPVCLLKAAGNNSCLIEYLKDPTNDFLESNIIVSSVLKSARPKVKNVPDSFLSFAPLRFTGFRANWVLKTLSYAAGSYLSANINYARVRTNQGKVAIQSTNAFDTPLIEMNHFAGDEGQTEIAQLIQHIRYLRDLLLNSNFSKNVFFEDLPGPSVQTDEQLTAYIRKYVWGHHACCTNKMGNTATDPMAVVNSKAQVKGIRNLRICDISIFPKIPGYFPVLPIATACEKIADDIIKRARG